jgi:FkbM family methyltransferase
VSILGTLLYIVNHPLNKGRVGQALTRFLRWQVGSRLSVGAIVVPFVSSTRLLAEPGMTGVTQNIYCGLHEFEDMAFVMHALRAGDVFVDVGANVGTYTVLASGVAGASTFSFEPVPSTFRHLSDNIRINDLGTLVSAKNFAIGRERGEIRFTSGLDTMNRALAEGESAKEAIQVPVDRLDNSLDGQSPTLIKIDVEGYETDVLDGATEALRAESLLGLLIELNGSGRKYGYDEHAIRQRIIDLGFQAASYLPHSRELVIGGLRSNTSENVLYVRKLEELRERLRNAPRFRVASREI